MPAGVRDYMPGDPFSYINWKASAKTGRLAVHRHDYTADTKLMVFFNVDTSLDQWAAPDESQIEIMENALRLLASILNYSVTNGMQTALHTNSVSRRDDKEISVPPAFGSAQREELFSALAEIRFKRTRSFHMMLHEAAGTVKDMDILIMTRFLTKEMDDEIAALRKAGNKVEIFMIPDSMPGAAKGDVAV